MFSDISARAQENFSGARLIRAYVQEEAEIRAFEAENQEYIRRSYAWYGSWECCGRRRTNAGMCRSVVLWLGGREVIHGLSHVNFVWTPAILRPGITLPAITTTLSYPAP